ncbi:heavy metal translocating P-type ATPase [Pseudodesulfovibrio sp. zrk46]|uniref:heavy metal translocating P-type ATPase n=1 Tax=Pseudodesulfovibrio sp. zrk46 TaxID=2725288 RepID=UPI0014493643|nr:heavy metal translocating P-type ATPase [Pseudodesulfovibrio sp. zrk46]QJB56962.1 heavy metal translocating P-type ATPase [Pseudodesulfovibrio sp. zrk46]
MSIVRSIPGRIRFEAESEQAVFYLQEQLSERLGEEFGDAEFRYSKRSGRGLALFAADAHLTERVADTMNSIFGTPDLPSLPRCKTADPGDEAACTLPALSGGLQQPGAMENPFWIVAKKVANFYMTRLLMPMSLRPYWTAFNVAPLIFEGVRALFQRKLNVAVLDAAAIGAALAMRDFNTAGTIHLLLDISETLEDWTREKSRNDLEALFAGDGKPVWVMKGGAEVQVPQDQLQEGDLVIVRSGARIPVDGVVADGTAMVNQSSMTGEPLSVKRGPGKEVYAGTVVEEGKIIILSEGVGDETRFAKIAHVIADSESMKAEIHGQAVKMADKIVPFSFILSGVIFAITRNWMQAAAVLMADYSCAIKISTPLAVRSAMLEAAHCGALVKGGKHIEQLSKVNAIVLDKTGTLTRATPEVVDVCPVNGYTREFVLRNAACMEEHFPHPVADAVVRKADEEGLIHHERHAEVEYILAHGISTTLDGKRMILGSRHFVNEDEGIDLREADKQIARCVENGLSTLYMAVGNELAGVIALEDPLRDSAYRFIRRLENIGMERIIMLTGDGEATARSVAEQLDIEEFYAQVLPEDKTELVESLRDEGYTVAMVGDGINDSAALSRSHVGVSMKHGADIAQEACDVMLTSERLDSLMDAMSLSKMVMRRIKRNYQFIVVSNTLFIGLGVFGLISPAMLAFLHNSGTVLTCAQSMRPMLPEQ